MSNEEDFSDLDELMAIDPLELSKQNLDRIIAYQRKQRAQREAGIKPKKPKNEPTPAVSLSELLTGLKSTTPQKKPGTTMKRRF